MTDDMRLCFGLMAAQNVVLNLGLPVNLKSLHFAASELLPRHQLQEMLSNLPIEQLAREILKAWAKLD
jgi:hypothetical protein